MTYEELVAALDSATGIYNQKGAELLAAQMELGTAEQAVADLKIVLAEKQAQVDAALVAVQAAQTALDNYEETDLTLAELQPWLLLKQHW